MNQACSFWDSCYSLWLHYIKRALYLESKTIFVEAKVVHWFRGPEVTQGKLTLLLLVIHTRQIVKYCLSERHNCRAAIQCTVLFVCRHNCRAATQCSVVCLQTKLQGCNTVNSVVCLQTQLQNSIGRSCDKHIARLYKRSSVLRFDAVSIGK
jgi:hypothetical protein